MNERPVRFMNGGLDGQLSEIDWPAHLPLPASDLTVIEMPSGIHKGIAIDRNGDHHLCLNSLNGYGWNLAY